jgi:hypothetical protein
MPIWPSSRLFNSCLLVATAGVAMLGLPTPAIAQDVDVHRYARLSAGRWAYRHDADGARVLILFQTKLMELKR